MHSVRANRMADGRTFPTRCQAICPSTLLSRPGGSPGVNSGANGQQDSDHTGQVAPPRSRLPAGQQGQYESWTPQSNSQAPGRDFSWLATVPGTPGQYPARPGVYGVAIVRTRQKIRPPARDRSNRQRDGRGHLIRAVFRICCARFMTSTARPRRLGCARGSQLQ